MNKPKKPSKKIELEYSGRFYFDHVSKKISLKFFLDWIKDTAPKGSYDISVSLDEEPEYCYCDEICCGHGTTSYLAIYWKRKVPNKLYDKELKKYKKKLVKWKNSK